MELLDDSQRGSGWHGGWNITIIMDGNGIFNIIMTEINLIDTMLNQVAQCAGCNVYEPWAAMVIGAGAAFVYLCIHTLMIRWWIRVMLVVVLLKLMVLFV